MDAEHDVQHGTACTIAWCGTQLDYILQPTGSGVINWTNGYTVKITMNPGRHGTLIGKCRVSPFATGSVQVP